MGEVETRLAIGGERVDGAGVAMEVENPFTEETIATVGARSAEQLDAAIAAAAEAQRGWERTPAVERGEMLRELKAGTVWFNDPLTDNDAGPFGGFRQSGLGRELGREGLEAFQETKHVHIETRDRSRRNGGIRMETETLVSRHSAVASDTRTLRNYIGGDWVEAAGDGTLEDRNPATGELTALVPLSRRRRRRRRGPRRARGAAGVAGGRRRRSAPAP